MRTINASLDAAWDAQRSLDEVRLGLGAFESVRTALGRAGIGSVSVQIKDFNAARNVAESVLGVRAGVKEAMGGVGAVALARGLASVTFPKPTIEIPKPALDLKPFYGEWNKLASASGSVRAQAEDMLRLRSEGLLSSLLEVNRQPVLGSFQGLSKLLAQPRVAGSLVQPAWVAAMASSVTGGGMLDGLRSGGIFEATRDFQSVAAGFFSLSQSLAPYFEIMARAARGFAEYATSRPGRNYWGALGVKALEALEAFDAGRHWIADAFLERYLRLGPTPERREALWMVLKKGFEAPFATPPPWLTLDQGRATRYLRAAVYREAERIKRDREMKDRLWGKLGELPLVLDPGLWGVPDSEDPGVIVARKMDDRAQVLEALLSDGTARDRKIAGLVLCGEYSRAEIRNEVGNSDLQSFERKAQRMRKQISFS